MVLDYVKLKKVKLYISFAKSSLTFRQVGLSVRSRNFQTPESSVLCLSFLLFLFLPLYEGGLCPP